MYQFVKSEFPMFNFSTNIPSHTAHINTEDKLLEYAIKGENAEFFKLVEDKFKIRITPNSTPRVYKFKGNVKKTQAIADMLNEFKELARELTRDLTDRKQVTLDIKFRLSEQLNRLLLLTDEKIKHDVSISREVNRQVKESMKQFQVVAQKSNAEEQRRGGINNAEKSKEIRTEGFEPRNKNQATYYTSNIDPNASIIFAAGPAGVGKTYPAIKAAIDLYLDNKIERILILRPMFGSVAKLGALPGDMNKKSSIYTEALNDAIISITGVKPEELERAGIIRAIPYTDAIRGTTFRNTAVLIDEAQSFPKDSITTTITRIGENTKIIVSGDISGQQNDLRAESSGLVYVIRAIGEQLKQSELLKSATAFIKFEAEDSTARHPLLPDLIRAFNNPDISTVSNARISQEVLEKLDKERLEAEAILETYAPETAKRYLSRVRTQFPSLSR